MAYVLYVSLGFSEILKVSVGFDRPMKAFVDFPRGLSDSLWQTGLLYSSRYLSLLSASLGFHMLL